MIRCRFGRGWFSASESIGWWYPRQLPRNDPIQKEFTILKACVFLKNCAAFGFSLTLTLCLWYPKNFSRGSCDNFPLRKTLTPGMVKRNSRSSTNEWTVVRKKSNINVGGYSHFGTVYLPVVFNPKRVSGLRSIAFFANLEKPGRSLTLFSHSLR